MRCSWKLETWALGCRSHCSDTLDALLCNDVDVPLSFTADSARCCADVMCSRGTVIINIHAMFLIKQASLRLAMVLIVNGSNQMQSQQIMTL